MNDKYYIPENKSAEDAVLSACMINSNAISDTEFLTVDDFYSIQNKNIYSAIRKIYQRGEHVDLVTIISELQRTNMLEAAGGISYITLVCNNVVTTAGVVDHAKLLRRLNQYRSLINAGQRIQQIGYDAESENAFEEAVGVLNSSALTGNSETATMVKDTIDEALASLKEDKKGGLLGLSTGLKSLDLITRGLRNSDYLILAARPSMGKTALAAHLALSVARASGIVAMFSLEMSAKQVTQRLITSLANIKRTDSEKVAQEKLISASNILKDLNIYIDEKANTLSSFKAAVRRIKNVAGGLDFVIIDYINLMASSGKNSASNRNEIIAEISRSLKQFAKEINIPIMVLCQLNREVEYRATKVPSMSDLRESGSLEQDADVVILMYRDDYYKDKGTPPDFTCDLIVAKNRNGKTGTATVMFDGDRQLFKSIDYNPKYNGGIKDEDDEQNKD